MEKKKVLFVDDRQSAFDILNTVFEEEDFFELANHSPIYDEGRSDVFSRERQKKVIQSLLREEEYEVVLFDLTLRSKEEEVLSINQAQNLLSITIYNEMKEWFEAEKKKVVFVTSHQSWNVKKFQQIGELVEGAFFLKKTESKGQYLACPEYDTNGNTKCGVEWKDCNSYHCFNMKLRRIVKNG